VLGATDCSFFTVRRVEHFTVATSISAVDVSVLAARYAAAPI